MQYGLRTLPPDERDFTLGALRPLPELPELPKEFRLPFTVKDQGNTDFCTAYATCAVSEAQERITLEPAYTFAATKYLDGDVDSWGADLRTACKSHQLFGALPSILVPETHKNLTNEEKRNWKTWQDFQTRAYFQRKKSYFQTKGQYDAFDNIRASIWQYKTPVAIGIQFGYAIQKTILGNVSEGFGHALCVIGWEGEFLLVGNSYGTQAGDNGIHYMSREVINHWVKKYGAYTFLDISPEEAKKEMKRGILWRIQIFLSRLWM